MYNDILFWNCKERQTYRVSEHPVVLDVLLPMFSCLVPQCQWVSFYHLQIAASYVICDRKLCLSPGHHWNIFHHLDPFGCLTVPAPAMATRILSAEWASRWPCWVAAVSSFSWEDCRKVRALPVDFSGCPSISHQEKDWLDRLDHEIYRTSMDINGHHVFMKNGDLAVNCPTS